MKNGKTKIRETPQPEEKIVGFPLTGDLPANVTMEMLQAELKEDMARTGEGVTPRLPQVDILHAGAQMFKLPPDETGSEERVSEFEGIIIDQHACNAYWEKSFSETGGGVPPDCSSLDGRHGSLPRDTQGKFGDCLTCKFNQYGTGTDDVGNPTKGKSCKNMKRIHFLVDGHILPWRLTVPPTSIEPVDSFLSGLIDRQIPYTTLRVKFTLTEGRSGAGIEYSKLQLSPIGQIPVQKYLEIKNFLREHLAQIRGQAILAEEYMPEQNGAGSGEKSYAGSDNVYGKPSPKDVEEIREDSEEEGIPF